MKIAIDASRAVNEKAGVGKYVLNLVNNLLGQKNGDEFLLLFNFARANPEKEKIIKDFSKNFKTRIFHYPGKIKDWLLKSSIGFSRFVIDDSEVFLAPTFLDFDVTLKIPQVLVIHDLTNFLFPEHAGANISQRYQKMTKVSCQKATHIITVSESTKKDIIRLIGIPEKKITCIYPGTIGFAKLAGTLPEGLKPKSYFFNVGTIEPRKNLKNLLKAYQLLPNEIQEKYPLVIVGARGWNNQEELKKLGANTNVRWLGYVSDEELGLLYKSASVFVYPSLYEGFGLPIAEAMQFGVPVITSNISSMPEVAGEAGILINPEKPVEIKNAIEKVLLDNKLAAELSQKAIIQAQKFSWAKCAQEVLAVLKNPG